jgi:hypothetical protein
MGRWLYIATITNNHDFFGKPPLSNNILTNIFDSWKYLLLPLQALN